MGEALLYSIKSIEKYLYLNIIIYEVHIIMKFSIIRDLKDETYAVKITLDSFGSEDMSKEAELKLLDDHGPAEVNIGGKFVGKWSDDEVKLGEPLPEETNAVKLDFVRNYETVTIDEGFAVTYEIKADSIIMTDKLTEAFSTKNKVAEAKAELFVAVMKQRLTDAITAWKELATDFDTQNPEEFVI